MKSLADQVEHCVKLHMNEQQISTNGVQSGITKVHGLEGSPSSWRLKEKSERYIAQHTDKASKSNNVQPS